MTIQIAGKQGLQKSYLTVGWQWVGPKPVTAVGLRNLLQPGLPDWDLSQPPKIETFPVTLKADSDVVSGFVVADGQPGEGTPVPAETRVRSKVLWNIKRKDGVELSSADTGEVRGAIRSNVSRPIRKFGFFGVGRQPGAVKFSGDVPIKPPLALGLIGLGMVTLAANIRSRPV